MNLSYVDLPKVRYLPAEYVDNFFARGELLLTTYEKCRTHEDLARRDVNEGKSNFFLRHGTQATAGIQGVGRNSYMLCTSLAWSEEVSRRFSTNCAFFIEDTEAFAHAIAKVLPGVQSLQHRACRYVNERSISGTIPNPLEPEASKLVEAARSGTGGIDKLFHELREAMSERLEEAVVDKTYFMKEAVPFAVEEEFRFVWTVDHAVGEPIVVTCPEAVQYCKPAAR